MQYISRANSSFLKILMFEITKTNILEKSVLNFTWKYGQ
jgi:hypothetical protein